MFRDVISFAGNWISWQLTGVGGVNTTSTAHTFFSCTVLLYSHLVTDFTQWPHASRVAQESRSTLLTSLPPHILTPSRNVVRHTSLDDTEHGHSFLTSPESFLQRSQTLRRSTATAEWRFALSPDPSHCVAAGPRMTHCNNSAVHPSKEVEGRVAVVMTPLNWCFAQLFPSISSVSTEQQQICVENKPETHEVRWNPPRMRIWNQWLHRHNFPLLTLFLRLIPKYKETCCVNTNRNSQTFLNNRTWPNSAPMLVSRRTLRKDSSSLHLMMMHLAKWKDHVECIPYLEVRNHPAWEGGSVETRRSAQSWMWESVIIKNVTVWRSWSNLHHETNGINKYVTVTSEETPVTSVENRGTGKPVAKAQPRPKPTLTLSLVSIPYRERKWIDVEPGKFSPGCFEVSIFLIRLLRHDDTGHREDDWAASFDDLAELFKSRFAGTSQWSIEAWVTVFGKRRRTEEKVSVLHEPQFFHTYPVFPSNPGTFRRYSRWSYSAKQCTVAGWLHRVHLPHRERWRHALHHPEWIDSGRKKSQMGKAVGVLHRREPDVRQSRSGRNSIRSG